MWCRWKRNRLLWNVRHTYEGVLGIDRRHMMSNAPLMPSVYALEMEHEERTVRMQRLRKVVKEQDIYRWAANLIGDLCDIRLEIPADANAANRAAACTS